MIYIFTKKICRFTLVTLVLLLLVTFLLVFSVNKLATFELNEDVNMLVLGHSHPECAFNDSLIVGLKNLGRSSESPYYTYQKVRRFLPANPHVNTVFIEFSNNMLRPKFDEWILDERMVNRFFPLYAPFMGVDDYGFLLFNSPRSFISNLPLVTRKSLDVVLSQNFDFSEKTGAYLFLQRNRKELFIENGEVIETVGNIRYNSEMHSMRYFIALVEYCLARDLNVYFVRSPKHKYFMPEVDEENFHAVRKELFPSVEFLDFGKFPLGDDEFGDLRHLNHKGAKVFSHFFQDLLDKGLLAIENKNDFIRTVINNLNRQTKTE